MWDHIFESEPYQKLTVATRSADYGQVGHILNTQVALAEGRDKVFWMGLRLEWARMNTFSTTDEWTLWPEVEAMYRYLPNDPVVQRTVASNAIAIMANSQRKPSDCPPWTRALYRGVRLHIQDGYLYWAQRAGMLANQRRWRAAYCAESRAIACFLSLPAAQQQAMNGRLILHHLKRVQSGLASNQLNQIEADFQAARDIMSKRPGNKVGRVDLAWAEGGWALHQGRYRDAHMFLQQALILLKESPHTHISVVHRVDIELLAARLARAEGNMVSFDHFARRALAIAEEHRLPLTAAAVRAVLAGAEY
ncbi:MAG TPA: hypothetical protein VD902_12725 [Symbiobacteriaceae bacterium]|nr:hypothetical protein [Symbiobacteriaceae bacterium]